jgi:outer membrane protein OmpA-like peptidoglycan-associated protein
MTQPLRWLWGLAPLALLWGAGNVVLDDAIQQDIGRRAIATAASVAGEAPGARPITARVVGRDVAISGEALSADGAARAIAQLNAEFGVRRALGGLSQVVAQRPYSWSATRQDQTVTLNGFVPDEETAKANVAAASAARPGLRVDDRQELAFGAPPGFQAMTRAALAELSKLASGKIALDDQRFCIEGKAETSDAFLGLKAALGTLPQAGFQAVECLLEPPVVAPYVWSAERRTDGSLGIAGNYPSDDVRNRLLALLRNSFPGARIEDLTKPALGAPAAFLAKVTRAVGELARLRSGKVELTGDAYAISGQGPESFEACQALRLQIAQLDGPDSVAQATIACPDAPPPLPPMPALPEIPPVFVPREPAPADPVPAATPALSVVPTPPAPGSPATTVTVAPAPPATAAPVVVQAPAPPPVALVWQAEKTPQGLVVTGSVPDEAARASLRAAASELAKAGPLDDRMRLEPNLAKDADFPAATRFAFELLGHMMRGVVSLAGSGLTLAGDAAGEAGWRALEAALARSPLPGGLQARAGATNFAVRPYELSISVDKSGVGVTGYLPDAASRDGLAALVEASPLRGKLTDSIRLMPSAPAGFAAAARLALADLLRLDMGSADITDKGVAIRGLTCRDLIKREVETSASESQTGLKVEAVIGLRQTGCVIDPPNTCQNDLDALTRRNTVLFGQGTSVVNLDTTTERVINEAFTILKQCPASRITVEGHANRDGEWRGFDNLDLSQRRALRVRDELVRRGLDPAQLDVAGFGTTRPIVPHGAPDARAMNRRVQFTVAK